MNILKNNLAPVTERAWEQINQEAVRTLKSNLSARKIVDVIGPKGFEFSSVPEGRLEIPEGNNNKQGDAVYGIRKVFPLVESRVPFELDLWEIDNAERGARDIDLDPLILAAEKIAGFEEKAVYKGIRQAKMVGMSEASKSINKPLTVGPEVSDYLNAVVRAKIALEDQNVEGPYSLVLGPKPYQILYGTQGSYPVWKQVEQILGGKVHLSRFIEGGFFVSSRGEDMELTLGQDFSVGYESSDLKKVRLYFTESFTFQILNPQVIVEFLFRS